MVSLSLSLCMRAPASFPLRGVVANAFSIRARAQPTSPQRALYPILINIAGKRTNTPHHSRSSISSNTSRGAHRKRLSRVFVCPRLFARARPILPQPPPLHPIRTATPPSRTTPHHGVLPVALLGGAARVLHVVAVAARAAQPAAAPARAGRRRRPRRGALDGQPARADDGAAAAAAPGRGGRQRWSAAAA